MRNQVLDDTESEVAMPLRPRVFGGVQYDDEAHNTLAWVVRVVAFAAAISSWIFVGWQSGIAATAGCVLLCAASWLIRPMAFRIIVMALVFVVPLGLVVGPQIGSNIHMAEQDKAARVAAEKPYTDAVAAVKADLEKQRFTVDKLSLERSDMTRGEAHLTFHLQRTKYAKVILIKKDDRWTVNCPTASGPVDINANRYELGTLLYIAGECPAGFVLSTTPTP